MQSGDARRRCLGEGPEAPQLPQSEAAREGAGSQRPRAAPKRGLTMTRTTYLAGAAFTLIALAGCGSSAAATPPPVAVSTAAADTPAPTLTAAQASQVAAQAAADAAAQQSAAAQAAAAAAAQAKVDAAAAAAQAKVDAAASAAAAALAAETPGQSNARQSAAQYLSMGTGFSRAGLINQLSSSAGEGYSLADATYGVDAQHADWNAQAVLSAKNYLSIEPFSRAGLIEQLSSSAGEGFTHAQAVFGVTGAGL